MAKKRAAKYDPRDGMCEAHNATFDWLTQEEVDERYAKGIRQEQCATCKRWLWPKERGENFVSTGRLDTD